MWVRGKGMAREGNDKMVVENTVFYMKGIQRRRVTDVLRTEGAPNEQQRVTACCTHTHTHFYSDPAKSSPLSEYGGMECYSALKMTTAMYPRWYINIKCFNSYVISNPKPSPMTQCHGEPNFLSIWSLTNFAASS